MEKQPDDVSRRVTLSKAQRATAAGSELIALLTELSDDGVISREELARLRAWLEVDRGVDFAACGFLYEVVDTISADGEITEEELDTLAHAIERVLPPDIRKQASQKRKQLQVARREAQRATRQANRDAAREERDRARPLHRGDFIIAGALRSAERRDACQLLAVDERVVLEREPDNRHDKNAILILTDGGHELGYVPREDAKAMAPLIDAGAWADATVKKLLETARGTLPVVVSKLYRQGVERPESLARVSPPVVSVRPDAAGPAATVRPIARIPTMPAQARRPAYLVPLGRLLALLIIAYLAVLVIGYLLSR